MPVKPRFNPKEIRYGEDGVPIFRAVEIESVATEVLEKHCPRVLEKPAMTPILQIVEALKSSTGLQAVVQDLGHKGEAKILGKVNFTQKTLHLDLSLTQDREVQMRFTAAHECGHWILHRYNYRNWKLDKKGSETEQLEDDENTLCRLEQRTPRDWLEWHANVFAASLVIPRQTFQKALVTVQQEMGITRNLGTVYLSDAAYSHHDLQCVLSRLGMIYGVSKTSVRIRLETLRFLVDETAPAINSIGNLMLARKTNRRVK